MGFGHRHSIKYRRTERSCERVAGAYGVNHVYARCLLERHVARSEHVTAVNAARKHKHVEVVLAEDEPALVAHVKARIIEEAAYNDQLLVVDFQHVATLERVFYYVLGVEILPQVYVKNLQAAVARGHGVEKLVDGCARNDVPLSQRTEAHCTAVARQILKFGREGDVVPRHVLAYVIRRHALVVERNLHRSRGVRCLRHDVFKPLFVQGGQRFVAQLVLSQRADGHRTEAELSCMICEIGRCAAQFLAFGQHVPQRFAQSYDDVCVHDYKNISPHPASPRGGDRMYQIVIAALLPSGRPGGGCLFNVSHSLYK